MRTLLEKPIKVAFDTVGESIGAAADELQDIVIRRWWGSEDGKTDMLEMRVPGPGGGNPVWIATCWHQETFDEVKAWVLENLEMDADEFEEVCVER